MKEWIYGNSHSVNGELIELQPLLDAAVDYQWILMT